MKRVPRICNATIDLQLTGMDFQVKYSADNESTVTPRTVNTLNIDIMLVVKDEFKVSDEALPELHKFSYL